MITNRTSSNTYYNYSDLNRVEGKTAEVAQLLTSYGYPVTIETKTNWTRMEFPTATEMKRYLNNVKYCVSQYNSVQNIILPVSMNRLDYIGANNIEKMLLELEKLVDIMLDYFRRCGTFNCGEGYDD